MGNQVVLSLDGKLKDVLLRGLNCYMKCLKSMRNVMSNITDARSIQEEIKSIEYVISKMKQQTCRTLPKQTVLNQSCDKFFIKQSLSDLQANPGSVVIGRVGDGPWLKVRYVPQKGYELRVHDELVQEKVDLEVITESFVSWGRRKKIGIKEKAY